MMKRITEVELILPSLYLMSLNNGRATTSDLIQNLRTIMKPTGEDIAILAGRNDDKFSQKVRNLRAHGTFERFGYAEYHGNAKRGYVEITDLGNQHLKQNQNILTYLLINDFSYSDLKDNLVKIEINKNRQQVEVFDENIVIREGIKKITEVASFEQSQKLRHFAIQYYSKNNRISCNCCSFNFEDYYGSELGKDFIEIHHTKPIFKYENEDMESTLLKAVKNLMPVCSNCHRIIHRNWLKPLNIQVLIKNINENGILNRN